MDEISAHCAVVPVSDALTHMKLHVNLQSDIASHSCIESPAPSGIAWNQVLLLSMFLCRLRIGCPTEHLYAIPWVLMYPTSLHEWYRHSQTVHTCMRIVCVHLDFHVCSLKAQWLLQCVVA